MKKGAERKKNAVDGKSPKGCPKLPPKVAAQAKALAEQSGIPFNHAVTVVQGGTTLAQVLSTLRFQEQVAQLGRQKLLLVHHQKLVLAGVWPLEKGLFESRLRKRKWESDYLRSHLEEFQPLPVGLTVALTGRRMLAGQLVAAGKFDIRLQLADGQEENISKHDIKFFFRSEERKQALKQIKWGPPEAQVEPGTLRRIKLRVDIKAATYLRVVEEGRSVIWSSVEGDELRGRVTWFGRFEVVFTLPKGQQVYLMRHAVKTLL